jgi:branched-chain amino acid transport system ATP-binding protein
MAADAILKVSGITKRFGGVTALNAVSFDVARHGVTAVIGPNGAGKTTLFSAISGFRHADQGSITFDGHDITRARSDEVSRLGLVRTFQLVRLFRQMSVLDNVRVGLYARTRGGFAAAVLRPAWFREQERRGVDEAMAVLADVGLVGQAHAEAGTLTYGQQRLLEVARALAARPKLILLDEPAAGLNRVESDNLAVLIRRIRDGGTTVLFVEHDMDLVMQVAEYIHVIDFGQQIAHGTPAEVKVNPAVLKAYLGDVSQPVAVQGEMI